MTKQKQFDYYEELLKSRILVDKISTTEKIVRKELDKIEQEKKEFEKLKPLL